MVRAWLRDTRGSVLMVAGVCFLVLVAVGGAGYDFARRELIRLKLQQAADASALAGALLPLGTSEGARRAEVMRYYQLNFPENYLGVRRPEAPQITISNNVEVTASTRLNTSFIRHVGVAEMPARARSVVAIGARQVDFDVVLVVDESSSNRRRCIDCGDVPAIVRLRDAAGEMVDAMLTDAANPNVRMGLIGYSATITNKWGLTSNKTQAMEAVNAIGMQNKNYDHYALRAAYNMITGNTDASETSRRIVCGVDNPIGNIELDSALTEQGFSVNVLRENGINWEACPEQDNSNVPPPRTARADGAAVSKVKNVVFETDGKIMFEPAPCIIGSRPRADDPSKSEQYQTNPGPNCPNYPAFLAECDKLKNAGVTVFTISYLPPAPGDEATLKSCASIDPATGQPRYFYAPGSEALKSILRNIGVTIRKVRISE